MKKPRPANRIGRVGGKRRVAGWTLLVLGVAVAGVWVASGWWKWYLYWESDGLVSIESGRIIAIRYAAPIWEYHRRGPQFLSAREHERGWRVVASQSTDSLFADTHDLLVIARAVSMNGQATMWVLVLWPIPVLLWPAAALLIHSGILARRRAMTNACAKCGYSLAGLGVSSPCPECGK